MGHGDAEHYLALIHFCDVTLPLKLERSGEGNTLRAMDHSVSGYCWYSMAVGTHGATPCRKANATRRSSCAHRELPKNEAVLTSSVTAAFVVSAFRMSEGHSFDVTSLIGRFLICLLADRLFGQTA